MSTTVNPAPVTEPGPRTLWDFEQAIGELMDQIADLVPADGETLTDAQRQRREELEAKMNGMFQREGDKVDGVYAIFKRLGRYVAELDAEAKEILARRSHFEGEARRLANYVLSVMETWGAKKLEGKRGTLTRIQNPARVEVAEPAKLPLEFQRWEFTFAPTTPAELDACRELLNLVKGDCRVGARLTELKRVLQEMEEQLDRAMLEGQAVDVTPTIEGGARMRPGDWRLQVKP